MPESGATNWPNADTFQAPGTDVALGDQGDTTRKHRKFHADIGAAWEAMRTTVELLSRKGAAGGYSPMYNVVSKTANYTAAAFDLVLCNATGGAFNVTLPTTPPTGTMVAIKKTDASVNAVTLIGTIDGVTNPTFSSQWHGTELVYDGTNWKTLRRPTLAGLVDYPTTTDARYEQLTNKGANSGYMGLDSGGRGAQAPKLHGGDHWGGGADPLTYLVNKVAGSDTGSSSTTKVSVPNLNFPMAASEVWGFQAVIFYDGSTTGDLQLQWLLPAGYTGTWAGIGGGTGASSSVVSPDVRVAASPRTGLNYGAVGVGTKIVAVVNGVIHADTNPTTAQLQFSQNATDAGNATTVYADSHLRAWRLS